MNNSDRLQQKKHQLDRPKGTPDRVLEVKWSSRWEVFRRLQQLDVECKCSTNEPLLVDLYSPTTAIQIWSVLRQWNISRRELINWLDDCWEAK